MRSCVVCGEPLEGRRCDARHCGGPCRAEASRLRRILNGGPNTYLSVRERMAVFSRSNPLGAASCRDLIGDPQSLGADNGFAPQPQRRTLMSRQVPVNQPPAGNSPVSWLEFDEEVEVLWTDAEGEPQLAVGRFQGIAVPDGGGPIRFILRNGNDEISVHAEDVVGMTKQGGSR
jgi:hypothetical protein